MTTVKTFIEGELLNEYTVEDMDAATCMKKFDSLKSFEVDAIVDRALALKNKTKKERQTLGTCTNKSATRRQAYGAAVQVLMDRGISD